MKKDDPMYREALSWMSYRYAIGITESQSRNGLSKVERYKMFRDIEFDTEEFHALAAAFMDFLERKKIKDLVQLRDKYRECDLIWLSRNYAMGRHSYAASFCNDIMSCSNEVLSAERKRFMAIDIRRELIDHFRWCCFYIPCELEETHSPMDLFLQFITDNNIDTEEKLQEYSRIEVRRASDGSVTYDTKGVEGDIRAFCFMFDIDDYIGWDELASYFLPSCHKKCRVAVNGQEFVIPYINSWIRRNNAYGKLHYERIKVPIDKPISRFRHASIVEDYIVEDNIDE